MSQIRDTIIATAHSVESLRAAIPEQLPEFRDLLGPPPVGAAWDLAHAYSCKQVNGKYVTTGVSTCGLVAAGILRRAGVRLPWNGSPYWQAPSPFRGLDIVSELSLLGIRTESRTSRPRAGDVVCIGSGLSTHALTVVAWDGDYIVSVDGGQVDDVAHGFLQRTKVCRRLWSAQRVVWVIDVDKLHAALETGSGVSEVKPWTVEDTQRALRAHGYSLTVDGIAGPITRAAIIDFQRMHGLTPDGVVGPLTRAAMQA